jgi:hypothetical protein
MEEPNNDYYDIAYIASQKAINDVLINNNAFSNEIIFNYVTSRNAPTSNEETQKSILEALRTCGVKEYATLECKEHLEVLRKSFEGEDNKKFFSAMSLEKEYSIELLSDGALEIIEIDKKHGQKLKNEIGSHKKNLGVVKGGFVANFLHNWKVSYKLASLYLEKVTSSQEKVSRFYQADLVIDDVSKFVVKLNTNLSELVGRQFELHDQDIHKLNSMGVNYRDISTEDWMKLCKGEIAGPVNMVIGESKTSVLLMIKDDQIGCYHLNDVSQTKLFELANGQQAGKSLGESKSANVKQAIGNYLFTELGIVTVGFSNQDFELLRNGLLPNAIMRSSRPEVFASDGNNRMGKVRLEFDEQGKILGHEIVPRMEKLELQENYKGNLLSKEQIEELQKLGEVEKAVYLNVDNKENVKGFLIVDHSVNQVIFTMAERINIPSKVNGNEIHEEYKHQLMDGKSVIFYDFRHEGEDITAVVKLDKLTGQLDIEKVEEYVERIEMKADVQKEVNTENKVLEIPESFLGYEFSQNDIMALKESHGIKEAVSVEMNGERVDGFISVNTESKELVFLAKSDILIDKEILGKNELTKEQKQALVNGYSVLFPGFEQNDVKSNVKIEINRLDGTTKIVPVMSGKQLWEDKLASAAEQKGKKEKESFAVKLN